MYNFLFLDSLSFLQGSLAELVQDLAKSKAAFNVLDQMSFAQDRTGVVTQRCFSLRVCNEY